jgi:membrane-bound lytic murein transglycosylase MltF
VIGKRRLGTKTLDTTRVVGGLIAVMCLLALKLFSSIWADAIARALARTLPSATVLEVELPPTFAGGESRTPGVMDVPDYERRVFARHLKTRFPRYRTYFKAAAEVHGIPWKLLAAQAYQESHWDWKATSPTGVRGIMMLTKRTAAELGVNNRLDPVQSIHGGARYLAQIEKRLPREIHWSDRTFFALAAYNVGMGHLYDARTLAGRCGLDPNRWRDLESVLPLLSVKQYYKTLSYGYARGQEPVRYVERIRLYHALLEGHLASGAQVPQSHDSFISATNRLVHSIPRKVPHVLSSNSPSGKPGP